MSTQSGVTGIPAPHATSGSCRKVRRACCELMVFAAPRRYCRKVTALPIEADHLPPVPNTVAGIRALLPAHRRAEFDNELLAAVDTESLAIIRAFRKRWWALAAFETDPSLHNLADEPVMYASPIPR